MFRVGIGLLILPGALFCWLVKWSFIVAVTVISAIVVIISAIVFHVINTIRSSRKQKQVSQRKAGSIVHPATYQKQPGPRDWTQAT